ncbi:hypothetical protein SAMN05428945_7032 [Streptomyces sp. 2224.1]|uniref:hypothetical protein n=1 Tax=unclassified Streptomyces TaxID=2593676 RepID=UPI00088C8798|nr:MULTISPECIES: hypothetical protein [unclassified Streptomyces]PBC85572.1 hypothetical protein BX261_5590 [Streptomyces sp. 2321.6]SDR11669.1 hypothetical protein SAMN05216511_1673 [Streptomyces sp. KS_16]SED72296.1 hypothetical protein SAMN05428940_5616 [Streptomyces sp. 2133.1]SEE08800.1 hypothetical protein SAMN05428954_1749 [Streptomyces sp. 2112.3]SEE28162.1 hypothetical protein SAMN05428945_7032 [Streptomyces sp. 2224.1]
MGDSTWWTLAIAAVTGGTAVLASWVTSRGSAQAARIQGEISARSQRAERLRESRRTAYLDLIEQTHRMGELFWEISATLRLPGSDARTAALDELRDREVAEYAKIRRCARVVELEGPPPAAAAALALQKATGPFYTALTDAPPGDTDRHDAFNAAYRPFWAALEDFVEAARTAHQTD